MSGYVVEQMKRNPYDWRRSCGDGSSEECYAELGHIDAFLNQTKVKAALGVDEDASFQGISLVNEGLAWHGHPFFRFREMTPWSHDAKVAGRWKSYEELTYAELFNSGHLAPFDLPAESASLIKSWVLDGHPPVQ
ncbi:hypothetical protein COL5a_002647 [Colletotrichum fioriniae]|nr:hypothetical protein COL5a_002647 [Colletotrichum fioriniae]